MSLFIILLRQNCHLLTSNRFELLCNLCYSKFLLIDFVASLHHQPLISCGAKCYFPKLGYQLFSVQYFSKKLKTINFQFFPHSWSLKCRTFLRMACWDFWINALLIPLKYTNNSNKALGNMCIVIIYCAICEVINFAFSLLSLLSYQPIFLHNRNFRTKM